MRYFNCFLGGILASFITITATAATQVSESSCVSSGIDKELCSRAVSGDKEALMEVGLAYYKGLNINKNILESYKWFVESSKKGYGPAYTQLGKMAYMGQGGARDFKRAYSMFRAAATSGDHEAEFYLAKLYMDGHGVVKDDEKALSWLTKSANGEFQGAIDILPQLREKVQAEIQAEAQEVKAPPKDVKYGTKNTLANPVKIAQDKNPSNTFDLSFWDFLKIKTPWWAVPALWGLVFLLFIVRGTLRIKERRNRKNKMRSIISRSLSRYSTSDNTYSGHTSKEVLNRLSQQEYAQNSKNGNKVTKENGSFIEAQIMNLAKVVWGDNKVIMNGIKKLNSLDASNDDYVETLEEIAKEVSKKREINPLADNDVELDLLVVSLELVLNEALSGNSGSEINKLRHDYPGLMSHVAAGVWDISRQSYADSLGLASVRTIAAYECRENTSSGALDNNIRSIVVEKFKDPSSTYRTEAKRLAEALKATKCSATEMEMLFAAMKFFAVRRK